MPCTRTGAVITGRHRRQAVRWTNPTQFGMALRRLGIEMVAAYSPEAGGHSERAFGSHQGRLPQELALHGITDMDAANLPAFNEEFSHNPREDGSAFVPWIGGELDDYLCESHARVVNRDNRVEFKKLKLQIPQDQHRYHYIKAKVRVPVHLEGSLSIMHGPRKLARFTDKGKLIEPHKTAKCSVNPLRVSCWHLPTVPTGLTSR